MDVAAHTFIDLRESDIDGLQKAWNVTRLFAELDADGIACREIGYDASERLIHRWPGGESVAERGILDLAVFEKSTVSDISESEFARLWDEAIEEEKFFAEVDPYGDRFGKSLPAWSCLLVLLVLGGIVAAAYRLIS